MTDPNDFILRLRRVLADATERYVIHETGMRPFTQNSDSALGSLYIDLRLQDGRAFEIRIKNVQGTAR